MNALWDKGPPSDPHDQTRQWTIETMAEWMAREGTITPPLTADELSLATKVAIGWHYFNRFTDMPDQGPTHSDAAICMWTAIGRVLDWRKWDKGGQ
jgi:hypothetical protein